MSMLKYLMCLNTNRDSFGLVSYLWDVSLITPSLYTSTVVKTALRSKIYENACKEPVAASDWDGSAGWPTPQLWDVHTHNVGLGTSSLSSVIVYTAPTDCLVPVVFIVGNR